MRNCSRPFREGDAPAEILVICAGIADMPVGWFGDTVGSCRESHGAGRHCGFPGFQFFGLWRGAQACAFFG